MAELEHYFGDEGDTPPPAPVPYSTPPAIAMARAKLNRPKPKESVWPLLGAATFFACAALGLAVSIIIGPPQLGGLGETAPEFDQTK